MKVALKIRKLREDIPTPTYAHQHDSGFDLVAAEDVIIEPGETKIVPTGLAVSLPPGYEIQIRPRSGITAKTKLRVQLGTVDAGYTGEIGVIVDNISQKEIIGVNLNDKEVEYWTIDFPYQISGVYEGEWKFYGDYPKGTYVIRKCDRIAQAIVAKVEQAHFYVVDELNATERGEGGFGSSGVTTKEAE
jgi:dUTP pyrophosphatase